FFSFKAKIKLRCGSDQNTSLIIFLCNAYSFLSCCSCSALPEMRARFCKRSESSRSKSALIDLAFHWQKRTAFHPTMSESSVLGQALSVIRRFQKLICTPDIVPMLIRECHITARSHIVIHGQDEQRSCIRGRISVREILKPRYECGRL